MRKIAAMFSLGQLHKRLDTGDFFVDDSLGHRRFSDELVSMEQKAEVLKKLDIPWLRHPINTKLNTLFSELGTLWETFDGELRQGRLKHLDYDSVKKILTWHRPKSESFEEMKKSFYASVIPCDITDIFRFVNERCQFLATMTHLQPRYAKKVTDEDSLMAVILARP